MRVHVLPVSESGQVNGRHGSHLVRLSATISFVLDFDLIDRAVGNAPKSDAMYLAFGLMLGLVWLYLEILRLLAKLRGND